MVHFTSDIKMILTRKQSSFIEQTIAFVKSELTNAEGGHDWWHIYRVWKMACKIAEKENVDLFIVQLAALLHDIADPKFHDGNEDIGPEKASAFLKKAGIDPGTINHVLNIIRHMSFKNSLGEIGFRSNEMDVVQDADRLDAIGAIGIARAFNYGGFKNRPLYDPDLTPRQNMSREEYKKGLSPTINHFYEKLLLLKDRMNTNTGKQMADERHRFMEEFLDRFYSEWEGRT